MNGVKVMCREHRRRFMKSGPKGMRRVLARAIVTVRTGWLIMGTLYILRSSFLGHMKRIPIGEC